MVNKHTVESSADTAGAVAEPPEPVPRTNPKGVAPPPTPRVARTMRSAVLSGPREIRWTNVALAEPRDNEVRVRLEGCGVCGSNLAPWEGRPWFHYPFNPGQPGHEGWGRVDAIGSNVSTVEVGDRVAMLSYNAFAEYDFAPETCVVRLPGQLEDQPFPGEALGCAMNVFRRCEIREGQTIAIIGIGFLGAVLTNLCARAGAHVIAIGRRLFALQIARQMGATETIALDDHERIISEVKSLTVNQGCDRVIEATGQQWPIDLAGELTRERGRLIIAGYHQDGARQVNMQLWNWRGLDVINAHERDPAVYLRGMQEAVEAVASGQLDPSPLYTHRFPLAQLSQAFQAMEERPERFMKALVIA